MGTRLLFWILTGPSFEVYWMTTCLKRVLKKAEINGLRVLTTECRGGGVLCFLQCGGEEGCASYSEDMKRVVFLTV
jgi:hypothetical protein